MVYRLLIAPERDRRGSFSASSAGVCPRRQVFEYYGLPKPDFDTQTKSRLRDGKWRHLRWQTMLLDANIIHGIEGKLKWIDQRTRGSIDGVGVVPADHPREEWRGKEFGLELKGVNGFQFGKYNGEEAKEDHLNQVHRYFILGGFDLFVILYENKSTQDLLEWVIEPDPVLIDQQMKELEILNSSIDNKELPPIKAPCGVMMGKEFEYCPYGGKKAPCLQIETMKELRDLTNNEEVTFGE
jgi:hypothetical protein